MKAVKERFFRETEIEKLQGLANKSDLFEKNSKACFGLDGCLDNRIMV